jgi:hypothetical protein
MKIRYGLIIALISLRVCALENPYSSELETEILEEAFPAKDNTRLARLQAQLKRFNDQVIKSKKSASEKLKAKMTRIKEEINKEVEKIKEKAAAPAKKS